MSLYVLAFLYAMGVWGLGLSIRDVLVAQLIEHIEGGVGDGLLGGVEEAEEGSDLCHVFDHALELFRRAVQPVLDILCVLVHVFSIRGFYY